MYSISFKLLEEKKHLDTGYPEVLSTNTPLHPLFRLCPRATRAATTFNYTTLRICFKTSDDSSEWRVNEFICIIRLVFVSSVPLINARRHIYLSVWNNDDDNNTMVIFILNIFSAFECGAISSSPILIVQFQSYARSGRFVFFKY